MRALEYRRDLGLQLLNDVSSPTLGPEDILLQVHYAGVCGSDLHILAGRSSYAQRVILGHEMVGSVAALGPEAPSCWHVGDVVSMCPQYSCGECHQCQRGRPNFCEKGGYHSTVGYWFNGCFADYVAVHSSQVYRIPAGLSPEQAVLAEPFNCLLSGIKKLEPALDDPEARVLILGGGIFGLLWSALLCARGIRQITLTEPRTIRRRIAAKYLSETLGLSRACSLPPDALSPERKFDIVIECCGLAEAVGTGLGSLDIGGTLLIFGGPPKGSRIVFDPSDILFKELTIKGTIVGQDTFAKGIDALVELEGMGFLDWQALGVQAFPLEDYEEAQRKLGNGSICKAIFALSR
jgi:L-iditol 2-dehydrogenase